MYIHARRDPDKQWIPVAYKLSEEDVSMIVNDWEDNWKKPVLEEERSQDEEGDRGKHASKEGEEG